MGAVYNGVDLSNFCLTETHETTAEKDPSRTDTTLYRTHIRVTSIIAPGSYPAVAGEQPGATADRITALLCAPRRSFVYTNPGFTLTVPGVDDANGPEPDEPAFSIKTITPGSFLVTWGVSVRLRRCTGADARGFLSLKWSDAASYATDGTCTRRRTGLLITSRQFRSPDELRGVVTPAVPAGFRRRTSDYERSEDGLRLKFNFVDEQLHKPLPWPAIKITGHQVETAPELGGLRRGELSIRLHGTPGTDPVLLFGAGMAIGLGRVYASRPLVSEKSKKILIGSAVRESLGDSETVVDLSFQWMISPQSKRVKGVSSQAGAAANGATNGVIGGTPFGQGFQGGLLGGGLGSGGGNTIQNDQQTPEGRPQAAVPQFGGWLGLPFPGADPNVGIAPPTRGVEAAASLKLYAAALMDPCGASANLAPSLGTDNYLVGTDPTTQGTTTLSTGPAELTDESVYADDPLPGGVFEHWEMKYSFRTTSGYTVLPSTVPGQPGRRVRFGNPEKFLRVEWSLKRVGDAPDLPAPQVPQPGGYTGDGTHDPLWVGLETVTTYSNVDAAADGASFLYVAAGVTQWKSLDATRTGEAYPLPPWLRPAARPTLVSFTLPTPAGPGGLPSPAGSGGNKNNPFGGPNPLP